MKRQIFRNEIAMRRVKPMSKIGRWITGIACVGLITAGLLVEPNIRGGHRIAGAGFVLDSNNSKMIILKDKKAKKTDRYIRGFDGEGGYVEHSYLKRGDSSWTKKIYRGKKAREIWEQALAEEK